MSGKRIQLAAFLVAGLALAACASTRIVESWKAPGAGQLHFKKVLAVAILKNQGLRQNAEDALKGNLKSVQAVQSYTMFDLGDLADRDKARQIAEYREQRAREASLAKSSKLSLEGLAEQIKTGAIWGESTQNSSWWRSRSTPSPTTS